MTVGFHLKAYSSSHQSYKEDRYVAAEDDLWFKSLLSTPHSGNSRINLRMISLGVGKATSSLPAFQEKLVEAIDEKFSKLEKVLLGQRTIFDDRMIALILINPNAEPGTTAANKAASFILNFTGKASGSLSGMKSLVHNIEEHNLGNKVVIAIMLTLIRFYYSMQDANYRTRGIVTISLNGID